jgi:hypothetical protein
MDELGSLATIPSTGLYNIIASNNPLGIGPEYRTKGIECLIESALYFTMSFDE